jgi:hypothetical protein
LLQVLNMAFLQLTKTLNDTLSAEAQLLPSKGTFVGQQVFYTGVTPAIPVWWNGSAWVNASGSVV